MHVLSLVQLLLASTTSYLDIQLPIFTYLHIQSSISTQTIATPLVLSSTCMFSHLFNCSLHLQLPILTYNFLSSHIFTYSQASQPKRLLHHLFFQVHACSLTCSTAPCIYNFLS